MILRLSRVFIPPADVIELDGKMVIVIEIAGMRSGDFNLALQNHRLIVSGRRERPHFPHRAYHQVEIGFGEFRVEFTLPWDADKDAVSATYQDGFLQIELPRRHIMDVHAEEQDEV
jgi:HSP20 family protein